MKTRSLRADVTIQVNFGPPIFDWWKVPARFFASIQKRVLPHFAVAMRDFSVASTSNLGEMWAKYSLFSGPNNATLFSDRLVVSFSGLNPVDYSIATQVCKLTHDAFVEEFSDKKMYSLEYRTMEHLEFTNDAHSPKDFFKRFGSRLNDSDSIIDHIENGVQFKVDNPSDNSSASLLAEQSLLSSRAIFVVLAVNLRNIASLNSFEAKYEVVGSRLRTCLGLVDIEIEP